MGIKSLGGKAAAALTDRFAKQIYTVKANSPAILLGVGIVSVTASTVLACRATLKLSDVLEKGEKNLEKIEGAEETEPVKKAVRLETAIEIVKLYGPSVALMGVGILTLTKSHKILAERNANLASAYAIVDQAFKRYRKRVIADQGEDKDFEYLYGVEEREIVEEGPNGPEVKTVKGVDQEQIRSDYDMTYSRLFDQTNENWQPVGTHNQFFIQMVHNHANDMLTNRGFLFLNDVYDMLDMKRTPEGQVVGWIKDTEIGGGDGYVDFGVWRNGVYQGKEWVNGHKDVILLDFNVDGPILAKISQL